MNLNNMETLTALLSKSGRTELENEAIHKILWSNELLARMFEKFGTHSEKDRIQLCGYFNIISVKPGQLVIKQNTKNGLKVFVGLAGNSMVYKDELKIFSALEEPEKRMFTEIWENVINLAKTNDSQHRSSNPQANSALPSQRPPDTPANPKNPYARGADDKTANSLLKLPGVPPTINNLEEIHMEGPTAVDLLRTPMIGPESRLVKQIPEKSEELKPVTRLNLGVGFHQASSAAKSYVTRLKTWFERVAEVEADIAQLGLYNRSLEFCQQVLDEAIPFILGSDLRMKLTLRALFGKEVRPQGFGDMFGERALEGVTTRTATVVTFTDCIFLTLGADEYNTFVKLKARTNREGKHNLLVEKFPGYSKLASEDIWKFQYMFHLKKAVFGQEVIQEMSKNNRTILIKAGQVAIKKTGGAAPYFQKWRKKLTEELASDPEMFKLLDYTEHIFGLLPPGEKILLSYQGPRELVGTELFITQAKYGLFSAEVVSSELEYYELDPQIDRFLVQNKMLDHQYVSFFRVLEFRLSSIHKRLNLVYNGGNTLESRPRLVNYALNRSLAVALEENGGKTSALIPAQEDALSSTKRNSLLKLAKELTSVRSKNLLGKLRKIQQEEQHSRQELERVTGFEEFKYSPPIVNQIDLIKYYQKETKKEEDSQVRAAHPGALYKKSRVSVGSTSRVVSPSQQRQKIEEYYRLLSESNQVLQKAAPSDAPQHEKENLMTTNYSSFKLEVEGQKADSILNSKIVRVYPSKEPRANLSYVHDKVAVDLMRESRMSDSVKKIRSSMPKLNRSDQNISAPKSKEPKLLDTSDSSCSIPRISSQKDLSRYKMPASSYLQSQKRSLSSKYTSMAVQTVLEGEMHTELPQERIQHLFSVAADGSLARITKATKDSRARLYTLIGVAECAGLGARQAHKLCRKPSAKHTSMDMSTAVQVPEHVSMPGRKSSQAGMSSKPVSPAKLSSAPYFLRPGFKLPARSPDTSDIPELIVTTKIEKHEAPVFRNKSQSQNCLLLKGRNKIPADSTPFLI